MDDKRLIQGCIAKNDKAWKQFLKTYGACIYGSIAGLLAKFSIREPEIAEDYGSIAGLLAKFSIREPEIAEDIFASVIEKLLVDDCAALRKFSWKSKLSTWLVSVARNRTYDFLRRQKRRPTISLSTPIDDGEDEIQRIIAQDIDLDHDLEVALTVDEALDLVDDKDRVILKLYYIEGMKEREIGELLGTSVDAVSARKSRALKKLKILVRKGRL
jgi:RNA polymerase sigma-70 factor (ECF subfamily)